jgi:hypothetical protein
MPARLQESKRPGSDNSRVFYDALWDLGQLRAKVAIVMDHYYPGVVADNNHIASCELQFFCVGTCRWEVVYKCAFNLQHIEKALQPLWDEISKENDKSTYYFTDSVKDKMDDFRYKALHYIENEMISYGVMLIDGGR